MDKEPKTKEAQQKEAIQMMCGRQLLSACDGLHHMEFCIDGSGNWYVILAAVHQTYEPHKGE